MSILRSMNTGASGLRSNSEAIGVVGDNIANVNTVGFKKQRGVFEDILGRSLTGSSAIPEAGAGSRLAHIEQMWSQGALMTTDNPTDLAISGNGFFVVHGNVAGTDANYFTRAGQFHIDESGLLVDPNGMKLQGHMMQENGIPASIMTDLNVTGRSVPARATTVANVFTGLDANTPLGTFDTDPPASSVRNSVTAYDSLGRAHQIDFTFVHTDPGRWGWRATVDGQAVDPGAPAGPLTVGEGSLDFDTNGNLLSDAGINLSSFQPSGASPLEINVNFGQALDETPTGAGPVTEATTSNTAGGGGPRQGTGADGYMSGEVQGLSIAADGQITGVFSNGQRRSLAQIAVANFQSVDGLQRAGNGMWNETQASGEALYSVAGAGGNGTMVAGALEQANVDLGQEFVDLIAYQRGFQANSKIIQTADEMYGELVNLRR